MADPQVGQTVHDPILACEVHRCHPRQMGRKAWHALNQLTGNIDAAEVTLSADDLATLDAVSALPAEYPGWMLAMQGAHRRTLLETGEG